MRFRFVGGPAHGRVYDLPSETLRWDIPVATRSFATGDVFPQAQSLPFITVAYELRHVQLQSATYEYARDIRPFTYREWVFAPRDASKEEIERLVQTLPPPWQVGL